MTAIHCQCLVRFSHKVIPFHMCLTIKPYQMPDTSRHAPSALSSNVNRCSLLPPSCDIYVVPDSARVSLRAWMLIIQRRARHIISGVFPPKILPRCVYGSDAVALARRNFTVLALESSADDTCAAVVTSERKVLSNVVISQHTQCVYFTRCI